MTNTSTLQHYIFKHIIRFSVQDGPCPCAWVV